MITWIGKGRGLIQDSDREECVHGVVSINLQAQKIPTSTTIFQLPDVDECDLPFQ